MTSNNIFVETSIDELEFAVKIKTSYTLESPIMNDEHILFMIFAKDANGNGVAGKYPWKLEVSYKSSPNVIMASIGTNTYNF